GGERADDARRGAQRAGVPLRRSRAARLLARRALPAAARRRSVGAGARGVRAAAPDGDGAARRAGAEVKRGWLLPFLAAAAAGGCDKRPDLSRAPAIAAPPGWRAPPPLARVTASGARVVLLPDH